MRRVVFALWLLGLTTTIVAAVAADWKTIITAEDRDRLDRLAESISKATRPQPRQIRRRQTRTSCAPSSIRRMGPSPSTAWPGNWRCRTVKVGHILVVYSWFKCRIAATAEGLRLEKISGSQRLSGTLYSDGPTRLILLGAGTVNDDPPGALQRACRRGRRRRS
jgi:hypothetical protein